jgi:hypothetical protein
VDGWSDGKSEMELTETVEYDDVSRGKSVARAASSGSKLARSQFQGHESIVWLGNSFCHHRVRPRGMTSATVLDDRNRLKTRYFGPDLAALPSTIEALRRCFILPSIPRLLKYAEKLGGLRTLGQTCTRFWVRQAFACHGRSGGEFGFATPRSAPR